MDYVVEVQEMFPGSSGGLRYLFMDTCFDPDDDNEAEHVQKSMEELSKMVSTILVGRGRNYRSLIEFH